MKLAILIFLFLSTSLLGYYPNFDDNQLITEEMKEMMSPHLLPLDHPIKPVLDLIFSQSRVVDNEQSIRDAGFSILTISNSMIVARHPLVPGIIFKMYRDAEPFGKYGRAGWESLTWRCINAKKNQRICDKYLIRYFKIPDKWLYVIPIHSGLTNQMNQPVVLIAKDMEIQGVDETKIAWKTVVTCRHLDELYVILKIGYGNPSLVNNFPYMKEGNFAMIDHEKRRKKKVDMEEIEKFLSPEMKKYWKGLID